MFDKQKLLLLLFHTAGLVSLYCGTLLFAKRKPGAIEKKKIRDGQKAIKLLILLFHLFRSIIMTNVGEMWDQ